MKKKSPYRIRNWNEYNASLKQRGRLIIWVSSEIIFAGGEMVGLPPTLQQ